MPGCATGNRAWRRFARASRPCRALAARPPTRLAPLPPALSWPAARRGRLRIGYLITGKQLRGTVEVACRTDRMQVLTTLVWADRISTFSRRVLTDALRTAANPDPCARLHVFAVAARDLFRHVLQILVPLAGGRCPRPRIGYPARDRPSDTFIAETEAKADAPHGDLLYAIDALRDDARLRPRVTVTDRAEADRFVREARSALQGLYALFGGYLEQALQPLERHVSRDAVRAFVQEARGDLDELAACGTAGDLYVETLDITEPGDSAISLEIEGCLGAAGP